MERAASGREDSKYHETLMTPSARRNLLTYIEDLPRFGGREAYLWKDGVRWRRRTYGELHRRSLACAEALGAAGLKPGDPVLIQGPDGADWVEALFGTLHAGGIAVPLDPDSPGDLRARIAAKAGARLLVAPAQLAPPDGVTRIETGSWGARSAPAPARGAPARPAPDPGPDDRAFVMFTSGTTGDPRGVILTHGNLVSDFAPIERGYLKWAPLIRPVGALRFLSTLPLSHMFGQAMNVFLGLSMGLTIVLVPPRPLEVIEASRRFSAWGLFTVPRLLDLLGAEVRRALHAAGRLEACERRQQRVADWPFYLQAPLLWPIQRLLGWRLRIIVSGGARLPEEVDLFWRRSGYLVVQGYGLTETAPIISVSSPFDRRAGSVGRPLAVQEVKLGPEGEILVRGPNVTPGYLGEGREADGEGWLKTGDVGAFDARGRLTIRGRLKEVIVTPEGENVHPGDVEAAFAGAPGVRGVSVLGLPLARGERVHAALLMERGADPQAAVTAANERLLPKQRVRGHTVWPEDDFPRTATGKVRRGLMRDRIVLLERDGAAGPGGTAAGFSAVRRLLASLARVAPETLRDDTRLVEGLGFASLDLVELAAAFEEEFGARLPEGRLGEATVLDLERLAAMAVSAGGTSRPGVGAPPPARLPGPGGAPDATPAPTDLLALESRGSLRMPRWTRLLPVRLARRAIEECLMIPFIRFYARPRIAGLEHLRDARPPCLLVANHRSYMDTGLFKATLPRALRGRIAPGMTTRYHRVFYGEAEGGPARHMKEWTQVRLVEFFFNAWPLPETAGLRASLAYAGELMDEGFSILIFPEGRHVPGPDMEPFRKGIGIFARELRAPVVPAFIEGTAQVLPDGRYWPRFGRTRLVIGPPLAIDPGTDAAVATAQIEAAVLRLRPAP
jgi:long-chain acyl-CoA synthetase